MSEEQIRWKKCRNCRFGEHHNRQTPAAADWYECRKTSPIASPEDANAWWPTVSPDYWCGEWERPDGTFESQIAAAEYERMGVPEPEF